MTTKGAQACARILRTLIGASRNCSACSSPRWPQGPTRMPAAGVQADTRQKRKARRAAPEGSPSCAPLRYRLGGAAHAYDQGRTSKRCVGEFAGERPSTAVGYDLIDAYADRGSARLATAPFSPFYVAALETTRTTNTWRRLDGIASAFACDDRAAAFNADKKLGSRHPRASDWLGQAAGPRRRSRGWRRTEKARLRLHGRLIRRARPPDRRFSLAPGYQVPFGEKVRKETGIKTMSVGLIAGARQAEDIIAQGRADFVVLARGIMYDPRWAWHAAEELGAETAYAPKMMLCHPKLRPQLFPNRRAGELTRHDAELRGNAMKYNRPQGPHPGARWPRTGRRGSITIACTSNAWRAPRRRSATPGSAPSSPLISTTSATSPAPISANGHATSSCAMRCVRCKARHCCGTRRRRPSASPPPGSPTMSPRRFRPCRAACRCS